MMICDELKYFKDQQPTTYRVETYCLNCRYSGYKDVPRGIEKPRTGTCPDCGCGTLRCK